MITSCLGLIISIISIYRSIDNYINGDKKFEFATGCVVTSSMMSFAIFFILVLYCLGWWN